MPPGTCSVSPDDITCARDSLTQLGRLGYHFGSYRRCVVSPDLKTENFPRV